MKKEIKFLKERYVGKILLYKAEVVDVYELTGVIFFQTKNVAINNDGIAWITLKNQLETYFNITNIALTSMSITERIEL
jgi:hypothetical protein